MTNYQEQLKQAQAEFKEAMLTFCAAEAELNLAAWTYYEAEEILKTKQKAVERAIPPVVLESMVANIDHQSQKKRL
jgi:hypothetical protein